MKDEVEIIRGSGNIYSDLGVADADVRQFKAILATEIIKSLDKRELSVRKAQSQTGVPAADFSRIRNADLERFTSDRLMTILNRLGSRIEVSVKVRQQGGSFRAGVAV
jgi:predicted XRE-type DNA-binding protein